MQIMITPSNIKTTDFLPNDYRYAGALFITHSLYSSNLIRKFAWQTELVAGVRGPLSFAREGQTMVHALVHDRKPMGWHNQLSSMPLININISAEKNLVSYNNWFELNAGAQVRAGTMMDAVMIYPMVRIGKMAPYFDGFFSRFGRYKVNGRWMRSQFYFLCRPALQFVAYNAAFQGRRENEIEASHNASDITHPIAHGIAELQYGGVMVFGNFSFSYLQTNTTRYVRGFYGHSFGTVALGFAW